MNAYFLQTAALLKHYRKESGSEIVDEIFEDRDNEIYISNTTIVEFAVAMNKLRASLITDAEFRIEMRNFGRDVKKRIVVIPFYDEHIRISADLVVAYNLDALGAMQLAVAIAHPADLFFVSTDPLLLKAAQGEGMRILNPEE